MLKIVDITGEDQTLPNAEAHLLPDGDLMEKVTQVNEGGEFEDFGPDDSPLLGELTSSGWTPPRRKMPYAKWAAEGRRLRSCHHGVLWGVGDWLNYGEHKYGEMYAQAADSTGYNQSFLRVVKHVAGRFPPETRNALLSFSHHQEVAALDPETAKAFLTLSEAAGWSQRELREKVNAAKDAAGTRRRPKAEALPAPEVTATEPSAETEPDPVAEARRMVEELGLFLKENPPDRMEGLTAEGRRLLGYIEAALHDFLTAVEAS
jgi:hypothetical protein